MGIGNEKQEEIKGIGRVEPPHFLAIDNIYYIERHKHNLLNVSQMYDRENDVLFTTFECRIISASSKKLVLKGGRHKNVSKVWTSKGLSNPP